MQVDVEAIVCALRGHGEHGGIVRLFTREHGLIAAYVRGARSRRMRPVLMAGNVVAAQLRSRSDAQLPQATVELAHSRAAVLSEPLPAAAVDWAAALVTTALPERQEFARLHDAFAGLLDAVEAAPSAKGWAPSLVRFELLLLSELGFGLDLDRCASPIPPTSWWRSARDRAGRSVRWPPSNMAASCWRCRASFARAGPRAGPTSSPGSSFPATSSSATSCPSGRGRSPTSGRGWSSA